VATKVIVSYDGSDNDHDALALGRLLAAAGAELSLAYVRHSRAPDQSHEDEEQREAETLLAGGAEWLGKPEVPRYVVVSASTPEGLRDLAERIDANVVVFGPEYRTAPGHVDPQTSARILMEGGPLAVALAPSGLHASEPKVETVAAVTENGDPSARETAESLARGLGAAVAERGGPDVGLVVIGSRPGAVDGRVTLSSAAWYLVETVRCPVLAVPRGKSVRFDAPTTVQGGVPLTT
jgi:nucleotide-binding universal stress UspA family protein